jgi:hypothetical protein
MNAMQSFKENNSKRVFCHQNDDRITLLVIKLLDIYSVVLRVQYNSL